MDINKVLNYQPDNIASVFGALIGVLFLIAMAILIFSFICYLIKSFTVYKLAKKSNQKWLWWSFIPILQGAKVYRLAGFTEKFFGVAFLVCAVSSLVPIPYFALIVTIVHFILTYYVRWRVAANFGCGVFGCILNMVFEPFVLIYLALSNRVFVPQPMNHHIADFLRDMGLDDDSTENSARTYNPYGFDEQHQSYNEQQTPTVNGEIVE